MTGDDGLLYVAPPDTPWPDDEWVPLGSIDGGWEVHWPPATGERAIVTCFDPKAYAFPRSTSFTISAEAIDPRTWRWITGGRTHPRLSRMHRAYRSRRGRRPYGRR